MVFWRKSKTWKTISKLSHLYQCTKSWCLISGPIFRQLFSAQFTTSNLVSFPWVQHNSRTQCRLKIDRFLAPSHAGQTWHKWCKRFMKLAPLQLTRRYRLMIFRTATNHFTRITFGYSLQKNTVATKEVVLRGRPPWKNTYTKQVTCELSLLIQNQYNNIWVER